MLFARKIHEHKVKRVSAANHQICEKVILIDGWKFNHSTGNPKRDFQVFSYFWQNMLCKNEIMFLIKTIPITSIDRQILSLIGAHQNCRSRLFNFCSNIYRLGHNFDKPFAKMLVPQQTHRYLFIYYS